MIIEMDFETDGIEPRPDYPPKPVGVAIGWPGHGGRKYYAWGHPTENNCTKKQGVAAIKAAYRSGNEIVFHNSAFDIDVCEEHLGLKPPPWYKIHDTLFEIFLVNPYEANISLKPLADKYLDMPPDEQTELKDWILEHVRTPEGKKIPPSYWGAYISQAPGKLVGRYAIGDIKRTGMLHKVLYAKVREYDMLTAYDRERKFLFVKLKMERQGVPIDAKRLRRDVNKWEKSLLVIDHWLQRKLKAPDLDINSGEELANALESSGYVTDWILTAKGNRSIAKDNIEKCITDTTLLGAMAYRARLVNSIRNFGRPWLRMAEQDSGDPTAPGKIYCTWNQVRSADERGTKVYGARTGRLQSRPNFQNIPKLSDLIAYAQAELKKLKVQAEELEVSVIRLAPQLRGKLATLPNMRDYIIPGKGYRLNIRDYSQQELRILGHYEGGVLMEAYNEDPNLDLHKMAQVLINNLLMTNYTRRPIKITGFGLVYGMGVGTLAERIDDTVQKAKQLRDAYLEALPGLKELVKDLKKIAKRGDYIRTWGGRVYYCEPSREIKGRMRHFDYKMLNTLIQGSAADNIKEAAIYFDEASTHSEQLVLVHDEFVTRAPVEHADKEMRILLNEMERVKFDVPMLSDGKISTKSWAAAKKIKDVR